MSFFSLGFFTITPEQYDDLRDRFSDMNDAEFARFMRAQRIYEGIMVLFKASVLTFFGWPVAYVLYKMLIA